MKFVLRYRRALGAREVLVHQFNGRLAVDLAGPVLIPCQWTLAGPDLARAKARVDELIDLAGAVTPDDVVDHQLLDEAERALRRWSTDTVGP